MELRILGPVELVVDGRSIHMARRQQRLILGILAMEANRLVSCERLINLVWSSNPPQQARAVLQTRVSEIRSVLNDFVDGPRFLVTRDRGYLLNVAPDMVDQHRFRSLVRQARQATSDEEVRRLLRTAGELWRGPVLGGWLTSESHESLCGGLEEARLTADEDLWEVELKLGHHQLVVDEINQVAARNPGRERLVGLAMTALHRSGRTAEALRLFDRCRHWLASEWGVDPGAELRERHLAMLNSRPAADSGRARTSAPAVPRMLPSITSTFTGRELEAARIRTVLTTVGSTVRVAVVTGPAGVGKTALSVHVAYQVLNQFTDGQLYADLRGHDGQASPDSAEVLAWFLRALGVSRVPDEVDERAALYRSLLADRRVLVVLDNAHDAGQVRTLIPGAASCAVLVSSRARLGVAIGAVSTELDVLEESAAVEMLSRIVGRERIEREQKVAVEIIRLCEGLPLAVRIVAARLNSKPHWTLSQVRTRLADERKRLDHLAYGDLDVRVSILQSFAGLSAQARNLLCRLGITGTTNVNVWRGATLLGTGMVDAEEILEELHDAQLLQTDGTRAAGGFHRYRLRDLVRLVAAEQATSS